MAVLFALQVLAACLLGTVVLVSFLLTVVPAVAALLHGRSFRLSVWWALALAVSSAAFIVCLVSFGWWTP